MVHKNVAAVLEEGEEALLEAVPEQLRIPKTERKRQQESHA